MARQANSFRSTLAVVAFTVSGLGLGETGAAPSEKSPALNEPPPAGGNVRPNPKPRKNPVPARRKIRGKALPKQVALPLFGEYTAKDFASTIEALWGKPVQFTGPQVEKTPIRIDKAISEQYIGSDEFTLFLAAHRVYLVPHVLPDGTAVLMATRDPEWRPEPPRFRKVLEVAPGHFERVWATVESAVKTANSKLKKGEPPIVAVPAKRRGKIFLGAGTQEQIASLQLIAVKTGHTADSNRPRFYTYVGRNHRAQDLLEEVEARLTNGERNRLRIVVAHRGNRLLFRAPRVVGDKVEALLKDVDRKQSRLPRDLR